MANELTTLPVRADSGAGAIGITKENKRAVTLPTKELDALLYNNLADFATKAGGAIGLGDGTTAGSLEQRSRFTDPYARIQALSTFYTAESFSDDFESAPFPIKLRVLDKNRIVHYDFSEVAVDYEEGTWPVWILVMPAGAEDGDQVILIQNNVGADGSPPSGGVRPAFLGEDEGTFLIVPSDQSIGYSMSPLPWNYLQTKYVAYGIRMVIRFVYTSDTWTMVENRMIGGSFLLDGIGKVGNKEVSGGGGSSGQVLTVTGDFEASWQDPSGGDPPPEDGDPDDPTMRSLGNGGNQAFPGDRGYAAETNAASAVSSIGSLSGTISGIGTALGTTNDNVTALQGDVSDLDDRIDDLEAVIGSTVSTHAVTPDNLLGTKKYWDLRPTTAGADMDMTLPPQTASDTVAFIDMKIHNSAHSVNLIRDAGTTFLNDAASDLTIPPLTVPTFYRFVNTSFGQTLIKLGEFAP